MVLEYAASGTTASGVYGNAGARPGHPSPPGV